ncbi:putative cysteine protease atg4 [Golovinomyces cichoracearum]|uniref:Cysteine protease n=1 Tax=Golovinomyces cichoracearum TaxID=62708 RepID=A0A420IMU5_9PEZI|nr:putative cysteine protease atg4 [Golovinomyces cichoracearum]
MAGIEFSRYKRIVRSLWDPNPVNSTSTQSSVWCLGKEYKTNRISSSVSTPPEFSTSHTKPASISPDQPTFKQIVFHSDSNTLDSGYEESTGWPIGFLDDFGTRLSLTYRSGFPAISRSQELKTTPSLSLSVRLRSQLVEGAAFTSDTGWGCMIRSGQSLLANTLALVQLGRDWRCSSLELEERKIISLFADDPRAPFSIHNFVEHGADACGKHPGEWFGPSATARCIEALTGRYDQSGISVYVTGDGLEVYEDKFLMVAKPDGLKFKPTLILVGTRLGIEKITPVYWEALGASLRMPQSMGIVGGHPSSSYYFVGVHDSYFFYLDPHQTQPALSFHEDVTNYTQEEIDSCHTKKLRSIHIGELDPSMLLAFLIRDEKEWRDWSHKIKEEKGKAVVRFIDKDPTICCHDTERDEAIDEVETFDEDENCETNLNHLS